MAAHHELERALGEALHMRWGGSLAWELEGDGLTSFAEECTARGYPVRIIGAEEFARLEPHVADVPDQALLSESEGALNPVAATQALLQAASGRGARVLFGCEINGFRRNGGSLRGLRTSFGEITADRVVLAAGTATAPLLETEGLHLPMDNRDGLIVHTRPLKRVLEHLILSPEIHFRQETDGRIVIGEDFSGRTVDEDPNEMAERLLRLLKRRLPELSEFEIGAVMVGTRPEPLDGYPAVGFMRDTDWLYVASMHSGITLAPIIGKLAAAEISGDDAAALLEPFRPTRFNQ